MNVKEIKIVDTESKKFSIIDLSPEEIIDHPNFEQIRDQFFPDLAPLYGIFSTAVSEKAAVSEKDKPALYKAVQKELFVLAIGALKQGMESGLSHEQIAISIQKTIMENGEAIISRLIQNFTKVAQPQNDASVAASQNKATISETPVTPKENEMTDVIVTVKATAAATADTAAQVMEATRQTIQNTIADGMSEASFARYKADDFFSQDLSDIANAWLSCGGPLAGLHAALGVAGEAVITTHRQDGPLTVAQQQATGSSRQQLGKQRQHEALEAGDKGSVLLLAGRQLSLGQQIQLGALLAEQALMQAALPGTQDGTGTGLR